MSSTPPDYAALFRTVLGEWRKLADPAGGDSLKPDELARAMGGAEGGPSQAQAAFGAVMQRALAAANVPSRANMEDVSARLSRIEGALFRIEAKLAELAEREG